jgi:hypothetical protein
MSVSYGSSDMQNVVRYMCLDKSDIIMNKLIKINYM